MNRYISSNLQFIISASRKLAIALLSGIAFAACTFPETTLANDGAQTSPGGKVKAAKLAQQNGQPIWSIDIMTPLTKKIAAVQVDAHSGKVLSKLTETPGDRAEDTAPSQKKDR